ncbi:MAG: ester cyclase [Akkermansiaceae bacterium]|nr:ester cyclase [Akkermansiaceae bacterium]
MTHHLFPLLLLAVLPLTGSLTSCCDKSADTASSASRIERNQALMRQFEQMINTADAALAEKIVAADAAFFTPASPDPLYGGSGYLSVVHWMRQSFSDVQWKLEEMVAAEDKVAVRWTLTGTHDGEFLGLPATGTKIKTSVMNFYYINPEGKITNDIAADGMIGILRPLGLSK